MMAAGIAFLAGLLIGSFLNVCIYRMPRDLSVVRPRSYCPECKAMIAWFDNIPLVSYILLHGKCRRCGARIPLRYPVVEVLTGLLFFAAVAILGPNTAAVKLCVFAALMIGLMFSDLEQRILPDEFTYGGAAIGIVLALVTPMEPGLAYVFIGPPWDGRWTSLAESLLGAFGATGILWFVGFLYEKVRHRSGLGFGDVKMIGTVGAFLGLHGALQTMIVGSLVGSIAGLIYIKATKKDYSTYELPFGTFLGISALVVAALRVLFAPAV